MLYSQKISQTISRFLLCLLFVSISLSDLYAQQSTYGVNLSGLEWGTINTPNATELNYYKGKGLKLIRLPFLWERVQTSLGGPLNAGYLATLDGIVAAANTAGVSIILDMHNYCRYPYNGSIINTSGGPTIAQYAYAWKLLATHFAGQTAVYGYDIMNEPNNLGTAASGGTNYWFPMAQAAVDSIRKVDQTHTIIVEGDYWSHGDKWLTYNAIANNNMKNIVDPKNNLVFEAHQYFDSNGSGTYSSSSFSGNGANVNTGVTLITPFVTWLQTNNLKGYVGEYGIPNNSPSDQANWNSLLNNFLAYLQANCVMGTYWAGGPGWAYPNYVIGIDPNNIATTPVDAPQMPVVETYTTLAASCNAAMPLTLLDFYGQTGKQGTQLNWSTTNEINNAYFSIEKSSNGSEYISIGQVAASTNSNSTNNYSFTDAATSSGPVYYRLMIVDLSGNKTYSNIIEIGSAENTITVYPNPFSDHTSIVLNSTDKTSLVYIQINDVAGNLVQSLQTSSTAKIDIGEGLKSGIYLVQVNTDSGSYHFKIVKQ